MSHSNYHKICYLVARTIADIEKYAMPCGRNNLSKRKDRPDSGRSLDSIYFMKQLQVNHRPMRRSIAWQNQVDFET
jgi:hypothetical protein